MMKSINTESILPIINQPPFEPTEIEAIAIINVGLMYSHIVLLFFFIIIMIYAYKKIKGILPIMVIYLFSLIFGMEAFVHNHVLTEFSPMLEIFFLLFQTSIFLQASIDYYTLNKRKRGNK